MKPLSKSLIFISALIIFLPHAFCQDIQTNSHQLRQLAELSKKINILYTALNKKAIEIALQKNWKTYNKSQPRISNLKGIDGLGFPVYYKTCDNIISAATTSTNTVQPGGSLGINLSGSSPFLAGKIALWDEGIVYSAHNEFKGKTITIKDGATEVVDHVTHVAGTMLANGINPLAKGMSFGASTLQVYDFYNDASEMAAAAPGLLISNHSYTYEAGWNYNYSQSRWEWEGLPGDTVDYKFGFYSNDVQSFDEIAFDAPYYLIVQAAGNNREETGPKIGMDYYGYKSRSDATIIDKGARPINISSNDRYDIISGTANAKNILTVGAVYPLPNGILNNSHVQIAPFSSWGPTDDGRIKPDICGNGINVLSTGIDSPDSYFKLSGTSTATPNVSGSLFLLQEYFAQQNNGRFMRASTLKGLVCNTAFDAGNLGPDYIYGWGLLNMRKVAEAIGNNNTKSLIEEQTLIEGETHSYDIIASGNEDLLATICWTDPKGVPTTDGKINDRTPKLINDLDIRLIDSTNIYKPWVLNPDYPSANAIPGDNVIDNIEQVFIKKPLSGNKYKINITHKNRLSFGLQSYSLIITGISSSKFNSAKNTTYLLNVYPIPTSSKINIVINSEIKDQLTTTIYNIVGQKILSNVYTIFSGINTSTLDAINIPNGEYFLKLQFGGKVFTKKIIVIH